MSKNDGGAAFPQLSIESGQRDGHGDLIEPFTTTQGGMSLREWYAGMALQGILAGNPDADCGPDGYAADAYLYADAMIDARGA